MSEKDNQKGEKSPFKTYLLNLEKEYEKVVAENIELKKRIVEYQKFLPNLENKMNSNIQSPPKNLETRPESKFRKTFVDLGNKVTSLLQKNDSNSNLKLHREFLGHSDAIWSIRYLPFYNKNTYISTTSADGTCNIWSTEHSNPIVVYSGHSGSVNQVKFHPTSQLASTVSGDGSIHLWKFSLKHQDENEEEKPEKTEEEENEGTTNINVCQKKLNLDTIILDMDWSSDGSLITTGGWDNQVRLLNLSNEQLTPTQIFKGHEAPINTIQISAQNNLILSASRDSTIRIWDPRVLENVTSIKAHSGVVSSAIWAQNDKFIITGGEDGNLKYWDAKNMKTPIKTCFLQGAINKMSLSSYHSRICIGMASKRSKIYDMSGQVLAQFPKAHNLMITDCTWSPDGSNIFTCSIDKTAKQWLYLTDQN